jgi:hypothetical protein
MTKERTQPEMLKEMVESLSQAEGAASQLIHMLQDPRFMVIRESLQLAKEGVLMLAPQGLMVAPEEKKKVIFV